MVSKQEIPVAGLQLTVYGLEEYKALSTKVPVAVMFALHGRLQNMSKMEPVCERLSELNASQGPGRRHLIVVAFDHLNHGTRQLNRLSNFAWKEGRHQNPNHALDMWTMVYSASQTVSNLIDVLEVNLFGAQEKPIVEVWGVLGFSMGGHSSFLAAALDPRITVAIPIVGTTDYLGLMQQRLKESGLPEAVHLPEPFKEVVRQKTAVLDSGLKSTKLLLINGEKDKLVPGSFNVAFVDRRHKDHEGIEGRDWAFVVVPGVGHAWCPEMFDLSVSWCEQWMVKTVPNSTYSLPSKSML